MNTPNQPCPKCAELDAALWKLREESVAELFEIEGLKREVARAERAASFLANHLKCIRDFDDDSPWDDPGHCAIDALKRVGEDSLNYVPKSELDTLRARLDRLDAYPEECESVQGFILDVLEQLEKRGVDTTNWDGDESSATIMASCVAGKIREAQEGLDTLRVENERLKTENANLWKATSTEALDLVNAVSKLTQENERLREALIRISKLPTGQTASPEQCSAVVLAMDALAGKEAK